MVARSMKVLRPILIVSALAVLVLGVALAFWIAPQVRKNAVTLADGTAIELVGTGVGGTAFTTAKKWEEFARRHLPWRFQQWLRPVSSLACSSGSNSVTAYFLVTPPQGARPAQVPWQGYRAGDGRGEWLVREGGSCSSGGGSGGGPLLYGLIFRAHHRRQPVFVVQFLGPTNEVIAEFKVPNPVSGPFPEWQPQALPQTVTNGPVALTLRSASRAGRDEYPYLKANWQVISADPLWKNAKPGWIRASDATGNTASFLSLSEPAWKLTTHLHRKDADDFTDEEKRIFPAETPLHGSEVRILVATQTVSGATLNHLLLVAPGKLSQTNGQPFFLEPGSFGSSSGNGSTGSSSYRYWSSDKPALFFEMRGLGEHDEVQIRVIDPNGMEIKLDDSGTSWEQDRRIGYRRFPFTKLPETFRVEFIVSRPLTFEFVIDPKSVGVTKP